VTLESGLTGTDGIAGATPTTGSADAVLHLVHETRGVPEATAHPLVILNAGLGDDFRDESTDQTVTKILQCFDHVLFLSKEGG
jgi:hypothetical protein